MCSDVGPTAGFIRLIRDVSRCVFTTAEFDETRRRRGQRRERVHQDQIPDRRGLGRTTSARELARQNWPLHRSLSPTS